jgi:hypothetical protein
VPVGARFDNDARTRALYLLFLDQARLRASGVSPVDCERRVSLIEQPAVPPSPPVGLDSPAGESSPTFGFGLNDPDAPPHLAPAR